MREMEETITPLKHCVEKQSEDSPSRIAQNTLNMRLEKLVLSVVTYNWNFNLKEFKFASVHINITDCEEYISASSTSKMLFMIIEAHIFYPLMMFIKLTYFTSLCLS